MGRQIIKQPNGKYAIWSSIEDTFIYLDCTPQDIIEFYCQEYTEEITEKVNKQVKQLDNNEKPHYQFTKSWNEALKIIEDVHGKNGLQKWIKGIGEL